MGIFSTTELFGMTIRESANDGSDFTNPSADYQRMFLGEDFNLHFRDSAGTVRHLGGVNATAMPATPGTLNRVYRSDLGETYVYDGTRWRCLGGHEMELSHDAAQPASANHTARGATPIFGAAGVTDLWLEYSQTWFYVVGGTALSASHSWIGTLVKQPAGTTLATVTINSGASDTHRQSSLTTIGALLTSTNFEFDITFAKTGTPGTLFSRTKIRYQHVAT